MVLPCSADQVEQLTGKNVLVLFKQHDSLSKKIADYYLQKRAVPKSQLVGIKLSTANNSTISPSQFADIQQQIKPYLTDQIKVLLLTWHAPYRVGCMSITSAFSLGFDEKYCSHNKNHMSGCHMTANSPFFNAKSHQLWQSDTIRLTMMLSGRRFDEVKELIDRGVKADDSQPHGDAYLVRTQDVQRSTRWRMFKKIADIWPEQNGLQIHYVDDHLRSQGTSIKNKNNILFYLTGYTQVPDIKSNHYLPGAIADHLTSTGGAGISSQGQMKAFRWLEAGATGSYATVIEPCNYPQKFPNAQILIPSYVGGDSLIEAYWKSVQQPGEGLFIGEPLACPWCH
ncbi:TIGR03790 family protein [Methylophaga thalassica]|uniref:TIGR03790 family protein n=1 Tax=Methylophaga thalassica TaxID=40223 RepID=UPI002E7B1FBE|nr:TIGR03790 family protein [Methylophaga thalassica]WVI84241.1 TIGR03790 family protein [Methylophaga thalassica]